MLSRTLAKRTRNSCEQQQEEEQYSKIKCISKSNDNITTLWKAYDKKRNCFGKFIYFEYIFKLND